jgi:hypothetical protein
MALIGIMGHRGAPDTRSENDAQAEDAFMCADAMMKAREARP